MILLDTNVLVYAVGGPHPLRESCRRLVTAHGTGHVELAVTVEVLQEFAHIRAKRRRRADVVPLARLFGDSLTVVQVSLDDLDQGLELFQAHPGIDAFDAVLAAVALRHEAEALVSADRGFVGISGLRHVDPATPALDRLIATTP